METDIDEFLKNFDYSKEELEYEFIALQKALLDDSPIKKELAGSLFRSIHTMKGTAGTSNIVNLVTFLHKYEDVLGLISRNIHTLVKVDEKVFEFFLKSLDLIEGVLLWLNRHPNLEFEETGKLFELHNGMMECTDEIINHPERYFVYVALDEDLF